MLKGLPILPAGPFDVSGLIDLEQLRRDEIESLGMVKIVEVKDPTPIVPGAYLTGNIERVTEYEKGPRFCSLKEEIKWSSISSWESSH